MVLRARLIALALVTVIGNPSAPALAHENHFVERIEEEATLPSRPVTPGAMQERMEEHVRQMDAERPRTFWQRLMSWLGRIHPFAVHFPIALFPVALVALILAKRRGESVEIIRALIVVAGASSVGSGVLGWLTGGFTTHDPDAIHAWHRWLGTALAIAGAVVAFWAWRRRDSVAGSLMTGILALITALLLVQGWLGAVLVHGWAHMRF